MDRYVYLVTKYRFEFVGLMFVIMFVFTFFLGKRTNFKLANAIHTRTLQILKDNFHRIGFEEGGIELHPVLYHEYEYYASGRDNCHYCMIGYETKKR